MKVYYFKTILTVVSVLISLIPSSSSAEIVDRIVAIVNDEVITLSDLNKASKPLLQQMESNPSSDQLPRELQHELLQQLINKKLEEQEVARLKISVTQEEIDGFIEAMKTDYRLTDNDLMADLANQGLTMEEFREQIKELLQRRKLIEREVEAKITITDKELKDYYDGHMDEYGDHGKVRIQHILLTVPENATERDIKKVREMGESILKSIREGSDFGEMARKYSEALSAENGGNLDFLKIAEIPSYLKEILLQLQLGEVSDVVQTPIGLQIIKLVDWEKNAVNNFEDVKDEIYRKLLTEEINRRYVAWSKQLRDSSYIKILY